MYHDRISSMTRYNSLVTLRETNRWHKSRGKWMRVHSRAAWTANCRSLVSRSWIPKGKGAGISREYLFLLASYDFPTSDIYYIRRSAFRAKISFLPRVQYDNSSLVGTTLYRKDAASPHRSKVDRVCITRLLALRAYVLGICPSFPIFSTFQENLKNSRRTKDIPCLDSVDSCLWIIYIVDLYIWRAK